jgi:type I restriction enzyme, S subunit
VSELPSGWTYSPIDDLGELRLGKMLDKAKNQGLPAKYLRNINVRWFRFDLEDMHTILASPAELEQLSVEDGDLFVCEGGEPGRCAVWRGGDNVFVYQKALHRFRTHGGMVPELLMYRLRHDAETGALAEAFTGTTIKHLTGESLARFKVPVPPLPEQKRIADKLDALLARVDACRERLDRVPSILKRFRQSVLSAATSGELTREWREQRGLGSEWPIVDLESVASDFSYGSAAKSSKSGKVPVLRMGNIQDGLLDWEDLVFTSDAAEISKYKLSTGDVLFNRTNSPELVGKTAVFRGERDAIYAGYLIRVRCGERLLPDYLNYCLGSPAGREYCWQVKSDGVSQSNINARKLAAFTFGLPSVEEQQEIIRRVEALLALNVTLGTKSGRARVLVDRLTPSALAKAFHGELVPQDPADEPASALLKRIREVSANPSQRLPPSGSRKTGPRKEISAMGGKLADVLAEAGDWMTAQEAFRGCGISEGATTELVEAIYAELRVLERDERVAVEPVRNAKGVKIHDRLKLIAKS